MTGFETHNDRSAFAAGTALRRQEARARAETAPWLAFIIKSRTISDEAELDSRHGYGEGSLRYDLNAAPHTGFSHRISSVNATVVAVIAHRCEHPACRII